MADSDFRIVTKIDPQTASGTQKVKQDLRSIETAAGATNKALGTVGTAAGGAAKSVDSATASMERMTAAEFRAAGGAEGLAKKTTEAANSQRGLEAALERVLRATDAEAAAQLQLNRLLTDSKRLLDAGMISQAQYGRAQEMAVRTTTELNSKTGAQRMGMQQLGYQLGDVATMYTLGAKPAQIFGSQIGQITQAVQLMSNGTSKFANFLGGPWGIAMSVGLIMLAPLVAKLFEGNDALADAIDKLKKDAQETETARQANEKFKTTVEGVNKAIMDQKAALDDKIKNMKSEAERARDSAKANLQLAYSTRVATEALIANLIQQEKAQAAYMRSPAAAKDSIGGTWRTQSIQDRIAEAEKALADAATKTQIAESNLRNSQSFLDVEVGKRQADQLEVIKEKYDGPNGLIEQARRRAVAENMVGDALRAQITLLEKKRAAEIEALNVAKRAAEQAKKGPAGVATFRSREQAIGIAGRELQQAGYRVDGNNQFGRTTGHGNDADHNRFAIDVNVGKGVTEANVPEIKAKYDAMAKRYQARGFNVLWNGQFYPAGGSGPSGPIKGKDKHYDHMHIYAPGTIVGKATQASTEAQAAREDKQEATAAERAEDFVAGVVNRAASRGLPGDRQSQLNASIEEAFAEFERRFNRKPTGGVGGEQWQIAGALTEADARETAQNFEDAYVAPLKRLQELQGTSGRERQILNAQLEETLRLGRDLTPVEAAMIRNGIEGNDQLERQANILAQVQGPISEYKDTIAALAALLAQGAISQAEFNARMGEAGSSASQFKAGLPGMNSAGVSFEEQGAIDAAQLEYDTKLAMLEQFLAKGSILEGEAAAIRAAIWKEYQLKMQDIEQSRLSMASDVFGKLANLQNSKVKEIAAVGKAAAITAATIDAYLAINKALSTLPPPFNIAMAAAIGATAFANVASIAGLRQGGYTGDVGENQVAGMVPVHGKEFVVNARGTRENRTLLEAINSGRTVRQAGASGGAAAREGALRMEPIIVPAPVVNLRNINVTDARQVADFFATPEGEQVFVNLVNSNSDTIRRAAGGGHE